MRNRFDEQLDVLNNELIAMGALCESAIASAAKAMLERDADLAHKAIEVEKEIDHMEREIESLCLKLLLQQQPVARDLRQISAALKMITDMERIGDQAADISEILMVTNLDAKTDAEHIGDMARATIKMVTDSVEAFVQQDIELRHAVIAYDNEVDMLWEKVRSELIALIRSDPSRGEPAMDLMMIAKYFERIGDHAVNVAEWVEFSITGVHKEANAL